MWKASSTFSNTTSSVATSCTSCLAIFRVGLKTVHTIVKRGTHYSTLYTGSNIFTMPPRHRIDTQSEVQLHHFFGPLFSRLPFASKRFWFYEFLFVEILAVTKHF